MLKKLIRWLMGFQHRRQAQALIANYEKTNQAEDRTLWIGSFFTQQEHFLLSSALDDVYINKLPVHQAYVYYDIEAMKAEFLKFLEQLERNGAINTTALQEFQVNSRSDIIQNIFNNAVPVKDQLLELNNILNKIINAHLKQSASFRTMNLSRLIPLFEMYSILVHRVTVGYLATS